MTADVIALSAPSGSTAEIAPARGFNCFRFVARVGDGGEKGDGGEEEVNVLAAEPDFPAGGKPSHSGIPLLFPFPNRVKAGEFVVDQQESHLMPLGDGPGEVHSDGNGNAIHGFVFDRPWRVTGRSDDAATGEFVLSKDAPERADLWPGDAKLTVRYSLAGATLRCDLAVENAGGEPFPFGLGTHPYFALPVGTGGTAADCTVAVPAAGRWELIRGVPTGTVLDLTDEYDLRDGPRFGDLKLDDVYTRVSAGEDGAIESVIADPASGLRIVQRCDAAFREQVVFTPALVPRRPPRFPDGGGGLRRAVHLRHGRGEPPGPRRRRRVAHAGPGGEVRGVVRDHGRTHGVSPTRKRGSSRGGTGRRELGRGPIRHSRRT